MLGEVNRSLILLSEGETSIGEPITEMEFVNSMMAQMMEAGYKVNEILETDICAYIEIIAYKSSKNEEKRISNLLF